MWWRQSAGGVRLSSFGALGECAGALSNGHVRWAGCSPLTPARACRAEAFWKYIKDQKTQQRSPEANIANRVSLSTAVDIVVRARNLSLPQAASVAGQGGVVVEERIRLTGPRLKFRRRDADLGIPLQQTGPADTHTQQEALWKGLWLADPRVRDLYVGWEDAVGAENRRRPPAKRVTYDKPVRAAAAWVLDGEGYDEATEEEIEIIKELLKIDRSDVYECCRFETWYHRSASSEKSYNTFNAGVWRTVCGTSWAVELSLLVSFAKLKGVA